MATAKKVDESLYDMNDIPSTTGSGPARIDKPGITHNLKIVCSLVSGDYKDVEAKAASEDGKWHGFEVKLTDPEGLEMSEVYFMPPQKVEDVKYLQKSYEIVDGKTTDVGDASPAKTLKILNNEFFAYLIDIGEAMGYTNGELKERLKKYATGFKTLAQGFIDNFKASENTRVSAKILYNNNKNKNTSFLKIHGPYTVYYPFGNDLFDIYRPDGKTLLKISTWEQKNGMVKMYTNESDAPTASDPNTTGSSFKPAVAIDGEDPF